MLVEIRGELTGCDVRRQGDMIGLADLCSRLFLLLLLVVVVALGRPSRLTSPNQLQTRAVFLGSVPSHDLTGTGLLSGLLVDRDERGVPAPHRDRAEPSEILAFQDRPV